MENGTPSAEDISCWIVLFLSKDHSVSWILITVFGWRTIWLELCNGIRMENGLTRAQSRYSDGDTTWLNYRFSDGETTVLNIVYDYGTYVLWSLLFWTNHLYLAFLLSIPGMVLPPGYSLWLFSYKTFMWCRSDVRLWHVRLLSPVISPLCVVAQTSDCGIITILAVSAWGVFQTLVWHPVLYFGLFITTCVHLGFSYISWRTCDHIIIRSMS